ncbi:MAG: hypothetical protein ACKOCX_05945, partial [Planctomycetota bacterium]
SAGDRLECLRGRVQESFGKIDEQAAIRLMDRPVAAGSNLHNVLFVPERLVFHVAHASHSRPAAECPSVRLDLAALLLGVPGAETAGTPVPQPAAVPEEAPPAADAHAERERSDRHGDAEHGRRRNTRSE